MKKTFFLVICIIVFVLGLLLVSCQKQETATEPAAHEEETVTEEGAEEAEETGGY